MLSINGGGNGPNIIKQTVCIFGIWVAVKSWINNRKPPRPPQPPLPYQKIVQYPKL